MFTIAYDTSRQSLYHPGGAGNFFAYPDITGNEAALCAEMARLAYIEDTGLLAEALACAGFELCEALGYADGGTRLFVAKTDSTVEKPRLVAAFGGMPPDGMRDFLANANLHKRLWSDAQGRPLGRVYKGFADALSPERNPERNQTGEDHPMLEPEPAEADSPLGLLSVLLATLGTAYPRILLTGHSLGAALATLAAAYLSQRPLAKKIVLYTFGSPRVGNGEFVRKTAGIRHLRYENCCDAITRIPAFNYEHSGTLFYINRHGRTIEDIAPKDIALDRLAASAAYLSTRAYQPGAVWLRSQADHTPVNYLSGAAGLRSRPKLPATGTAIAANGETAPAPDAEAAPAADAHGARKTAYAPMPPPRPLSKSFQEIWQEELAAIARRRSGGEKADDTAGLAISGGGIRSATFALGVLETLKESGVLQQIDYLSTVSGGGYIGAWLSANCKRNTGRKAHIPGWLSPQADWNRSIAWLRRYSNYLAPDLSPLSADAWSMFTVWLRNTLLVQLMLFVAIATALLVPRLMFPLFDLKPYRGSLWIADAHPWLLAVLAMLLFGYLAACIAGNLKSLHGRNRQDAAYKPPTAVSRLKNTASDQSLVQFYVLLAMAMGFCLAALCWAQAQDLVQHLAETGQNPRPGPPRADFSDCLELVFGSDYPLLLLAYTVFGLFSDCSLRNGEHRPLFVWLVAPLPTVAALAVLLAAVLQVAAGWTPAGCPGVTNPAACTDALTHAGRWQAFVWLPPMLLCAFSLVIVVLIGMQGRQSFEYVREWWSRFGAWLAIYGFGWMLTATATVYGPLFSEILVFDEGPWRELGSGWLATSLAGLLTGKSSATGGAGRAEGNAAIVRETLSRLAPFVFIAGLLIGVSSLLHLALTAESQPRGFEFKKARLLGDSRPAEALQLNIDARSDVRIDVKTKAVADDAGKPAAYLHWKLLSDGRFSAELAAFLGCIWLLTLLAWRIDINEFGLNAFYRNRLSRCYLGAARKGQRKAQAFTGFDPRDDFPLHALLDETRTPFGPLHIVNCALNLGGSSDLAMHSRHSTSFTLTPLYCGSAYVPKNANGQAERSDRHGRPAEIGYIETGRFCGKQPPTLGQAISVSGAAARTAVHKPSPDFSLYYLLLELFGLANEKSEFLAISDGGHFENLGAYELIKRRCRVVVASDGECDPKLQFEGLANLIRLCRVDFGTDIGIDVAALRAGGEEGWSRRRWAVGKIAYGTDKSGKPIPDGWLIYLKAAMTGREDTTILQYKTTHPDFPHESTGNQFYGEDQFESYRCLGRAIAAELFAAESETDRPIPLTAVAERLFAQSPPGDAHAVNHSEKGPP